MTDLADHSARDLIGHYRSGALSPVEVTEAVLSRIAAWDPTLSATWALVPAEARAAARASERRWRRGEATGPLDGVPLTIKENIATRGTAMPNGTAATPLVPQAADGPAAARVREAGAVILGKTTMPDYGMLSSGLSSFHAIARNPWDHTKTPGGSSAGAGAAAAAGYGPLHLGTDIGGSVRLPAGWCGVVGLKPSFGRVPVDPPFLGRVVGPLTRDVGDAALLMAVIAWPDRRDHMSLPPADIAWTDLDRDLRGVRIGLWLDAGAGLPVDPAIRAAVEGAARAFAAEGALVTPIAPFVTRAMLDGLDRFWAIRFWSDFSRLEPAVQARVVAPIRAWIEGARHLSALDAYRGFEAITAFRVAALAASAGVDFLLSPVAPVPAFGATMASPTDDPARMFEHIGFTVPFSMSDQPAIALNGGYTASGLPIGLQIAGQRFDDLGVLRMARAYERLRPAQRPWPRVDNGGGPA